MFTLDAVFADQEFRALPWPLPARSGSSNDGNYAMLSVR
jgi:hypothetical protein